MIILFRKLPKLNKNCKPCAIHPAKGMSDALLGFNGLLVALIAQAPLFDAQLEMFGHLEAIEHPAPGAEFRFGTSSMYMVTQCGINHSMQV